MYIHSSSTAAWVLAWLLGGAVAQAHDQVAAAAQVVGHFLERLFGDFGDALVATTGQALHQEVVPGVEEELAHQGVGVVAVGLLDQQQVAEVVRVAQEGQLVLVAAAAFEFAGVG